MAASSEQLAAYRAAPAAALSSQGQMQPWVWPQIVQNQQDSQQHFWQKQEQRPERYQRAQQLTQQIAMHPLPQQDSQHHHHGQQRRSASKVGLNVNGLALGGSGGGPVTLILRSIARELSQEDVKDILDGLGLRGKFSFVYVPFMAGLGCNLSYCFVSFRQAEYAQECYRLCHGTFSVFHGKSKNVPRACDVAVASDQGGVDSIMKRCRKKQAGRRPKILLCNDPVEVQPMRSTNPELAMVHRDCRFALHVSNQISEHAPEPGSEWARYGLRTLSESTTIASEGSISSSSLAGCEADYSEPLFVGARSFQSSTGEGEQRVPVGGVHHSDCGRLISQFSSAQDYFEDVDLTNEYFA